MYSMTGFGRSSLEIDGRKVTIELKSVNHRYLDINMRLHRSVSFVEEKVRGMIKENLNRGHLDVYLYYENLQDDAKEIDVDVNLAKLYYNAIDKIRNIIKNKERASALDVATLPDVLTVKTKDEDEDAISNLIGQALKNAINALLDMRKIEGEKQKEDFFNKIDTLESSLENIKKLAPTVVEEYKAKLTNRMTELLNDTSFEVDQNRISAEIAFFADKSSIDEEITRLTSHLKLIKNTLIKDEPVGRQLDFVVQEINREVNTICSKSSNTDITSSALDMKNTVEKIREQVQNIE